MTDRPDRRGRRLGGDHQADERDTSTPVLGASVVMCAYTEDRWDVMSEAIEAVGQQHPAEVILVIDHNPELLRRASERWPEHVVVANAGPGGLSGARNTGVRRAGADVVVFLDDDAVPQAGWLDRLVAPFASPTVGIVGGRVVPRWREIRPGWFPEEFLWVIGCSYRGLPTETAAIRNPIGASMAVRSSVFEIVGGYVDGVGRIGGHLLGCEETEHSIRAGRAGFDVLYEPAAVVLHQATAERGTLRYYVRRCYGEGISKAMVAALAGGSTGLSSERTYVTHVLPSGFARAISTSVRGPDRLDALARAGALVLGLGVTAIGFVRGVTARRFGSATLAHK